ncbi:MAG: NAD-dependent epimerase/dehydratase family protein [Candidatus Cloacimonetes bacterium]|nr:NAD-dependent epimerase/dehydratase family protein [Candidatus Cloacimonadota bacterium]
MRILVLGGTRFVGRQFVEQCLRSGLEPELWNRGQTNHQTYTFLIQHIGDRKLGIPDSLEGEFDCIVDFCAYSLEDLEKILPGLHNRVSHYVLISTISVYNPAPSAIEIDENTETYLGTERGNPALDYGAKKVQCEQEVLKYFPDALILRPGILAGVWDPTNRYAWWMQKICDTDSIEVFGNPAQPIQFLDVSDMAAFILHALEEDLRGVFNLAGPLEKLNFKDWLEQSSLVMGKNISLQFLNGSPLSPQPLILPPEQEVLFRINSQKAIESGLVLRSHRQTMLDVLQWLKEHEY